MQRRFLFLACFFVLCADCIAQQYPFVFYTPKNGLVSSRVRKMYQDSRGRLYFITYGGLSAYDGARFRNYTTLNGLGSDMVNDVVEAGEDSLFVAPNTNKMNVLVNGQIKSFKPDNDFQPTVNQFLKSNDGNIYVTADEGFFVLKGKRFEELTFPMPGMPAVLPFLGSIVESGDMLLISTNDLRNFRGLYLYDKKNKRLSDAMKDTYVTSFAKDLKGRIWVSINNKIQLLDSIALKNGRLQFAPLPAPYQGLSNSYAYSFAFDNNSVWMIHSSREIVRANSDGSLSKILVPGEQGQGNTDRIFIDRENILWICSMGAGAYKLVNTSLQIDETLPGNSNADGVNDATYTNDTTWFIVNSKRLTRQTTSGTQTFTINIPDPLGLVVQQNGHLLICTMKDIYSAALPHATQKEIKARKILTLPDNVFGGLLVKDPYGSFIVTESGHVSVIRNDSIIFRYPLAPSDLIQSIKVDKQNYLWMAGRHTGLIVFKINPENASKYLELIHDFKKNIGEIVSPRSMILDRNGTVWLGTRYNGVMAFRYEKNDLKKVLELQTRHGLTDNFVTSLACDSSNTIIVGTQSGLDKIVPTVDSGYRIENITKSNGVFGYVNTAWVDSRNQSHALLNNGSILHISPLYASNESYKPDLFIEEIKVNGIPINPSAQNVQLSYTQRNLSFNVAAPAFVDEQQVKYSYLLEGSGNSEWSEPSSNAGINFLNLPPGEYTLQVKAIFPSTSYLPQQLSYLFVIVPPWWQTTWFRIIISMLAIIVLVLILRFYYARKLEKQKTILEKQQAVEKERTRIATDMHDDLGAGLSRIKFLSETIGIKKQQQQPIEEDISKIREYSHDMIDKMGEIVWALNKDNDTMSDLLSYTRAYAVEYLSQNGIQCIVEAPEQFPTKPLAGDFRRNIYLTVKEALHNIVKHSQASLVNIYMVTDNRLMITIQDNGAGFDEKNIRPFSNGLNNMKKRMDSLGGTLEIKNETGTSVVLTVPMN